MAIDESTGKIVGYIRWILPSGMGVGMNEQEMFNIWSEAIVPDVSNDEKRETEKASRSADWMRGPPPGELNVDELDVPVTAMKDYLLEKRNYLHKQLSLRPHGALALSSSRPRTTTFKDNILLMTKVLDYLAVHPDHGRQGIATKLVESRVQEADKLGLPIECHSYYLQVGGGFIICSRPDL
ncbi:hypothetical protein B7463_g12053, partial [Scytalidium lignicola]